MTPAGRPIDPLGKAALFSGQQRPEGPLTVECSGCGSHCRVTVGRVLRLAFPVTFTMPLRYHHTWMRCPACGKRNWVRIRAFL